jgi:hypothetical protein
MLFLSKTNEGLSGIPAFRPTQTVRSRRLAVERYSRYRTFDAARQKQLQWRAKKLFAAGEEGAVVSPADLLEIGPRVSQSRSGRHLLENGFEQRPKGLSCSVQASLYNSGRYAQRCGGHFGVEFFDVAEGQHFSVRSRQAIDTVSDLLPQLLGCEHIIGRAAKRFHRLPVVAGCVKLWQQRLDGDRGVAVLRSTPHEADIHYDSVQPCAELGVAFESCDPLERCQKSVLYCVGGVLLTSKKAPCSGQHATAMLANERFVSGAVAGLQSLPQNRVITDFRCR